MPGEGNRRVYNDSNLLLSLLNVLAVDAEAGKSNNNLFLLFCIEADKST